MVSLVYGGSLDGNKVAKEVSYANNGPIKKQYFAIRTTNKVSDWVEAKPTGHAEPEEEAKTRDSEDGESESSASDEPPIASGCNLDELLGGSPGHRVCLEQSGVEPIRVVEHGPKFVATEDPGVVSKTRFHGTSTSQATNTDVKSMVNA